jgi:CAAX prenyl protease-like protein
VQTQNHPSSDDNPKGLLLNLARQKPWSPYVVPFALFLALTALANQFPDSRHITYIVKTILIAALLWHWRHSYTPDIAPGLSPTGCLAAVAAGLLALALWILPDPFLPKLGTPTGFNPYSFGCPQSVVYGLIAVRLAGAALVVPVMEELFWRSFILRYAINPNFRSVPLGTFTIFSFTAVSVLFGLEHYRVIQGILAGIIYTLLVIKQKSLKGCILAHATTNLGLGIHVLYTQNWLFW